MAIPEAVQRQSDAADAMIKQAAGNISQEPPTPPAVVENQEPAPPAPPVSTEPVEPAPQPVVAPEKDYKQLYDNLVSQLGEQPYKVLQGKYNAEVPRMAAEIRGLREQIANMQAAPAQPSAPATGEAVAKMREDYGEDFVNSLVSIVRGELKTEMAPMTESVKRTEKDMYLDRLTALVPNWQVLMNDAQFGAFLDEVDPLSGRSLRDMAIEADASGDANRVAKFYQKFIDRNQTGQPAQPSPAPTQDRREALVAPAAQKGQPAAPANAGPKIYQASEIKRFHDEVSRGVYANKPEELKRLTAEMNLAISQGRVSR